MQQLNHSGPLVVGLRVATLATLVIAATALVAAQRGGQAPPTPPPGTPPKPLVPVAASTVATNPDKYVGEWVTLTATVEQNLSKTAFDVDQDKTKTTGKDVLVLAPNLQSAPDANTYITVIGELIKFDPAQVAAKLKEYQLDLSPADQERFKGKPVVLATNVINAAGIDIGKKPVPPPTADDLSLQRLMTRLPPAQATLRKGIDGSSVDMVKEQASLMKAVFTETEAFWKTKGNTDAMGIAADGKKHADTILTAVAAGKWDEIKAAATPLGAVCGNCHNKYRVRMEDGTFRIKTGG